MRRYLPLIQKGNGGKDNPMLSVVPQGDYFTAPIMKHNIVMKLERGEVLLALLSVKDKSPVNSCEKKQRVASFPTTKDFHNNSVSVLQSQNFCLCHCYRDLIFCSHH